MTLPPYRPSAPRIRATIIRSEFAHRPAGRSLHWQVVVDPDGSFLGGLFAWERLSRGGFDPGTVFEHVSTGERYQWNGTAMIKVEEG